MHSDFPAFDALKLECQTFDMADLLLTSILLAFNYFVGGINSFYCLSCFGTSHKHHTGPDAVSSLRVIYQSSCYKVRSLSFSLIP